MRIGPSELGRDLEAFSTSVVDEVNRVSSLHFRSELKRKKAHEDDVPARRGKAVSSHSRLPACSGITYRAWIMPGM